MWYNLSLIRRRQVNSPVDRVSANNLVFIRETMQIGVFILLFIVIIDKLMLKLSKLLE